MPTTPCLAFSQSSPVRFSFFALIHPTPLPPPGRLFLILSPISPCAEKILANGGEQEEGIFRVPALADAIQELKAQLESGDYEILTNDPNIPAATLKLWLRELLTPLIPGPSAAAWPFPWAVTRFFCLFLFPHSL